MTARIRELGGTPAEAGGAGHRRGPRRGRAERRRHVAAMLQLDLAEEEKAIQFYRGQIAAILSDADTVVMLKRHLDDETAHASWLRGKLAAAGGR